MVPESTSILPLVPSFSQQFAPVTPQAADQAQLPAAAAAASGTGQDTWRNKHTSEALMSKIACTLLSNMLAFGLNAMKKRCHDRNNALDALRIVLQDDVECKAITNGAEIKQTILKKWMDEDGP